MEDGVFTSTNVLHPPVDSAMDLDYMDELLLDGCWLETTDGSEFFNPTRSMSVSPFDTSSFMWLSPVADDSVWNVNRSQLSNHDEKQRPFAAEIQARGVLSPQPPIRIMVDCGGGNSNENTVASINRRLWIAPSSEVGPASPVKERLVRALECIKEFTRDKDALIQLWVPFNRGSKRFLTTNHQPFMHVSRCQRLASYREISVNYHFSAEDDSEDFMGLPGRVFSGKVPEWTPDVRFFKSEEYPRVNHAHNFDVRGTLAIPVFEQGSEHCLGVIEVVMTTQMVKSGPELENVCRALEAVDLRSSEIPCVPKVKVRDMSYQDALPEIWNVLRCACETHGLPLAQTWVPCLQQGKDGCRHSSKNYIRCVSTVDDACYVADPSIQDFHEACSEHHLLKGEGVAGKAFLTNQPCFEADITTYKKTEYPLAHHARMFRLHGAVAIRLRCVHTGTADYVLEFFLPPDCREPEEQRKMLNSLSMIMQQVSRSLRVVTDKELEVEQTDLVASEIAAPLRCKPKEDNVISDKYLLGNSQRTGCVTDIPQDSSPPTISHEGADPKDLRRQGELGSGLAECGFSSVVVAKAGEKRRTKAEKTITLDVLRQYFSGSLKDAAKSIGVCPTTLKRICRQHGIQRWPSRKIKKVGHSLQKIQRVIDSVQGVSGALQIGSFYPNFEMASSNLSQNHRSPNANPDGHSKLPGEIAVLGSEAAASKSPPSYSQSSSSSQCCSSGTQKKSPPLDKFGNEDPTMGESSVGHVFKRVRSEAELHSSTSPEGTNSLPRSHSQKSFIEHPVVENLPPLPEIHGVDSPRIKVTYGEEKIRFRMRTSWGFSELTQEIARRFGIDDLSRYDLKYLDDDFEWVLLTCDADLVECLDVYKSCPSHTIKLSLHASHHLLERCSGSTAPP